jgi:hypothetical protein
LKASTVIEILSAAHLARYVDHSTYSQRGGIFLVAPPGQLKSTLIASALSCFPDALCLSDLNIQTLAAMKSSFIDGKYQTLAFGEFEKLYQRNASTAANIEGHLKAMVEEGFGKTSFQDQRMASFRARVMVVAGITPSCYAKMYTAWMDNGLARRFLWCIYRMKDMNAITDSIHRWEPLVFGKATREVPSNGFIPFSVTEEQSSYIRKLLEYQPDCSTPYVLMKKILSVLVWRYSSTKAMDILTDFAESLSKEGSELVLTEENHSPRKEQLDAYESDDYRTSLKGNNPNLPLMPVGNARKVRNGVPPKSEARPTPVQRKHKIPQKASKRRSGKVVK